MVKWQVIPGLSPYEKAINIMEDHAKALQEGNGPEVVMLVEHEDVYTAGTGYKPEELLGVGDIPVFYTGRGGKFTYHGPGQRVAYPLLNLASEGRAKDIRQYVRDLEQWVIGSLNDCNIDAFVRDGRVGIWALDGGLEKKIGAIGVRVRKWVTYHGIAVNISTDLSKFRAIIPCGLSEFGVTSMKELGCGIAMKEFDGLLKGNFDRVFENLILK